MNAADDDAQLLRAYADQRDQAAFAEIVRRHVGMVYAAARRQLRDEHLAEDVTQAVFILLSRKAKSIAGGGTLLAGWLVNTARFCAMAAARQEARHHAREKKWAEENDRARQSPDPVERDDAAEQLDEALGRLTEADRTAITLRYLQGKPLREVAEAMHISEPAATKRVSRAAERLRVFFARRGIELAPAVLANAMLRHSEVSVPAHLAAMASSAASATAATAAQMIAEAVAGSTRRAFMMTAAAAVVVGIIVLMLITYVRINPQSQAASVPMTRSSAAPKPGLIRIGYYLSEASSHAIEPTTRRPVGYSMVLFTQMTDPAFEIQPVIEAGTENTGELQTVLQTYFKDKKPLIASDAAQLKTLDVLVAGSLLTPPDVVNAIEEATRSGMGLMTRNWFCIREPGYTDQVLRLYGLTEGRYDFENNALECEVIDPAHPMLASRKAPTTGPVMMRTNGTFGVLAPQSKGLIKVKDASKVAYMHGAGSVPENYAYYTVYTSELGQGRIVCCCYATYDTQAHLSGSVGPQFLKLALKWLAKR